MINLGALKCLFVPAKFLSCSLGVGRLSCSLGACREAGREVKAICFNCYCHCYCYCYIIVVTRLLDDLSWESIP